MTKCLPKNLTSDAKQYFSMSLDVDFSNVDTSLAGHFFVLEFLPTGCKDWRLVDLGTNATLDCIIVYNCLASLPGFGPNTFLTVDAFNNLIWTSAIVPPPLMFHNDTIYVDAVYGNNLTGVREDVTLPFQTINGAMGVALAGDLIHVRPGVYDEQIDFIDQVNFYLDKGAEITYSANPGFDYVFRDNGVLVRVNISGEGRIYGTDKLLIYIINPGSDIKVQVDQMDATDTLGNPCFRCDGTVTFEANKVDFLTATALPAQFRIAGVANIQCPVFNVYFLATVGTDATIVGDVTAYQTVGGLSKVRVYGDSVLAIHTSTDSNSFVTHIGNITNPGGAFGSAAISGFGANFVMRGNVTGGLFTANAINYGGTAYSKIDGVGTLEGFQGIQTVGSDITWKGNIFGRIRAINYSGNAIQHTVDIRGNLTSVNAQAVVEVGDVGASSITITGLITGTSTTNGSVFISGNSVLKIRDSVIIAGTAHGVNIDVGFSGIVNLKKCKVYSGGVFGLPVNIVSLTNLILEIDDSIFVSAPGAVPFSIQSSVPSNIRIYGSCMANNPYHPNITPVINAGPTGFIVDAVNVT